jgi:hypothetical protein
LVQHLLHLVKNTMHWWCTEGRNGSACGLVGLHGLTHCIGPNCVCTEYIFIVCNVISRMNPTIIRESHRESYFHS